MGMSTTFRQTITGDRELRARIRAAGPQGIQVLARVLRDASLLAFRESQQQVPHADGILAGSGVLNPPVISGNSVKITMGYGGAASKYAARQHEDESLNHPDPRNPQKSRPQGKAKYLEDPVREASQRIEAQLRARVAQMMGGS